MPEDMNSPANEWGCPFHAYNGYRQDEHYWAWVREWNRRNAPEGIKVISDDSSRARPKGSP